jgi:FMN phosphatase YigB (HAD superfamily)
LLLQPGGFSIDFFDTLFIRPVACPEDVFDLLGRQLGIEAFRERRLRAQELGFRRMQDHGRAEVTLDDVYACFEDPPMPADDMARAELALELALLQPNPDVFWLLQGLIAAGRPVVITSDMYLPTAFFEAVLDRYGVSGVPILVSCDCNATKRDDGALFDRVAERLGMSPADILHIGDNPVSDLQRAREKGLRAFLYRSQHPQESSARSSLAASLALGLLRCDNRGIAHNSPKELGYLVGGPAAVGFLHWIGEQASEEGLSHVLFISRDGYSLERLARARPIPGLPRFSYFLGSRTAFTLASMSAENFRDFLPFLLSGADGLAPDELLERVGVAPPAPEILSDLGLGQGVRVGPENRDLMHRFLEAYRWEILRVAHETRRGLYAYLQKLGIRDGQRIGLVDIGWSGTTQEAFIAAATGLLDLDVTGYYFCLADTPECRQRSSLQQMVAMVDAQEFGAESLHRIYANRVVVERLFSAPHDTVIGYRPSDGVVLPVYDTGRGDTTGLADNAREVDDGIQAFARAYSDFVDRFGIALTPAELVAPLVDLAVTPDHRQDLILAGASGFDAWGSSRLLGPWNP